MSMQNVTVIMPVYNAERFVGESIESILNQTFRDFDFLIINDGSSDNTEQIIMSYKDDRIKYIKHENNIGLIKTLNQGLSLSKTKYIVRMDSDDVSFPQRIGEQFDYMEKHHNVAVLGTWAQEIDENGLVRSHIHPPTCNDSIGTTLLFRNPMIHPSVIIRRNDIDMLNISYDENDVACEDYGLWVGLLGAQKRIENLSQELLQYRINSNGISEQTKKNKAEHLFRVAGVKHKYFNDLGISVKRDDVLEYEKFLNGSYNVDIELVGGLIQIMRKTVFVNTALSEKHFRNTLSGYLRGYALQHEYSNTQFYNAVSRFFGYPLFDSMIECTKYLHNKAQGMLS